MTVTQISRASASPTPALEGEIITELELAVRATGTALAEFEAAVAATATALAVIGQEPIARVEAVSGLSSWLRQWGDVVVFGGVALGASLLVTGLLYRVTRRRVIE